ncbi:MAG: glycosyltransferase family 39 protein [Acidimicrobiales bacterium]
MEQPPASGPAPGDGDLGRLVAGAVWAWLVAIVPTATGVVVGDRSAQVGQVVLALGLAAFVAVLALGPKLGRAALPLAGATAVGVVLVVPTIGRTVVLIGLLLALAAHASLVAVPSWRPGARLAPCPLALVPTVAAGLAWRALLRPAPALALVAVALALAVASAARAPGWLRRADEALVRGYRAAWHPVRRALGRALRWLLRSIRLVLGSIGRAARFLATRFGRPRSRGDVGVLVAIGVGGLLRAGWAIWAAAPPTPVTTSPVVGDYYATMNLRIADALSRGDLPTIGGRPTALWPPGAGIVMAPGVWLARVSGWFAPYQAGVAASVVAGTLTVWLCAALAARWFGPRAAVPAAWLFAIAPTHVFVSSVAILEPTATALLVGAALAATVVSQDHARPRREVLVWTGVLVGFAIMTTDRAWVFVLVPLLAHLAVRRRRTGALRVLGLTLAGVAVLLVPLTIRNGVQVGWWSPNATSIPEGMCTVKYEYDRSLTTVRLQDDRFLPLAEDCFRGSPFDDPDLQLSGFFPPGWRFDHPAEGAQARRNTSRALRWFASHPVELAKVAPRRLAQVGNDDDAGGLDYATHFDRLRILTVSQDHAARSAASWWYRSMAVMAIFALVALRSARRATVVWVPVVVLFLQPILGPYGYSRHAMMAYPFLAILAAGLIGAARSAPPPLEPEPA